MGHRFGFLAVVILILAMTTSVLAAPSVKEQILDTTSYSSSASNDRNYGYRLMILQDCSLYTVQKNASHNPTDAGQIVVLNWNTSHFIGEAAWSGDNATFATPLALTKGMYLYIFENETGTRTMRSEDGAITEAISRTYANYTTACYSDSPGNSQCDNDVGNANGAVQYLYFEPPAGPQWSNIWTNATPIYLGQNYTVRVKWTDDVLIDNISVLTNQTSPDTIELDVDKSTYYWNVSTQDIFATLRNWRKPGNHTVAWTFAATDTSSNTNLTYTILVNITDRFPIKSTTSINNTGILYVNTPVLAAQYFTDDSNLSSSNVSWWNASGHLVYYKTGLIGTTSSWCIVAKTKCKNQASSTLGLKLNSTGVWKFRVCMNDSSNQWTCGTLSNYTVYDIPPEYDGYGINKCGNGGLTCPTEVTNGEMYYAQTAVIYSNWTVPSGTLYNFKLYETLPNGTPYCNFTINNVGCNWTSFSCTDYTDCDIDVYSYGTMSPNGTHQFKFIANTSLGSTNETDWFNVTLVNDGPPQINKVEFAVYEGAVWGWSYYDITEDIFDGACWNIQNIEQKQPFFFRVNATDYNSFGNYPYNLSFIYSENHTGTWVNHTLYDSPTYAAVSSVGYTYPTADAILFQTRWATSIAPSVYINNITTGFKFFVNDSLGLWNNTECLTYKIFPNFPRWNYVYENSTTPGEAPKGSDVKFSANFSNLWINLSQGYFIINMSTGNSTDCGQDNQAIPLTSFDCPTNYTNCTMSYTYEFANLLCYGQYFYRFGANNTLNNWNWTPWTEFDVIDTVLYYNASMLVINGTEYPLNSSTNGTYKVSFEDWNSTQFKINWTVDYGNMSKFWFTWLDKNSKTGLIWATPTCKVNYNTSCQMVLNLSSITNDTSLHPYTHGNWSIIARVNETTTGNIGYVWQARFNITAKPKPDAPVTILNWTLNPCIDEGGWRANETVDISLKLYDPGCVLYPNKQNISASVTIYYGNVSYNYTDSVWINPDYCTGWWNNTIAGADNHLTTAAEDMIILFSAVDWGLYANGTVVTTNTTVDVVPFGGSFYGECISYMDEGGSEGGVGDEGGSEGGVGDVETPPIDFTTMFDDLADDVNFSSTSLFLLFLILTIGTIWVFLHKQAIIALVSSVLVSIVFSAIGVYYGFINGYVVVVISIFIIAVGILAYKVMK